MNFAIFSWGFGLFFSGRRSHFILSWGRLNYEEWSLVSGPKLEHCRKHSHQLCIRRGAHTPTHWDKGLPADPEILAALSSASPHGKFDEFAAVFKHFTCSATFGIRNPESGRGMGLQRTLRNRNSIGQIQFIVNVQKDLFRTEELSPIAAALEQLSASR